MAVCVANTERLTLRLVPEKIRPLGPVMTSDFGRIVDLITVYEQCFDVINVYEKFIVTFRAVS